MIQAIVKAIKVNKVTDFGCRVKILVGDVFEKLNNKLCGDKEKIRVAGRYFMEIWKVIRMKFFDKVEFLWCPDAINSRASEYWDLGLDIVGTFNGERIKKCCAIMGREENEDLNPGQIMYPYMLPDLKEGQDKMSKSDVSSASLWKMKRPSGKQNKQGTFSRRNCGRKSMFGVHKAHHIPMVSGVRSRAF